MFSVSIILLTFSILSVYSEDDSDDIFQAFFGDQSMNSTITDQGNYLYNDQYVGPNNMSTSELRDHLVNDLEPLIQDTPKVFQIFDEYMQMAPKARDAIRKVNLHSPTAKEELMNISKPLQEKLKQASDIIGDDDMVVDYKDISDKEMKDHLLDSLDQALQKYSIFRETMTKVNDAGLSAIQSLKDIDVDAENAREQIISVLETLGKAHEIAEEEGKIAQEKNANIPPVTVSDTIVSPNRTDNSNNKDRTEL
ncbi:uncharacterized protein LOC141855128 [Brevipalpus obovatus]|uniref:uncharacterized protein LOC141855128 n=1 Tax=Brevipalpus obovatus TaxID=246614 RepID=UPI003D9E854C